MVKNSLILATWLLALPVFADTNEIPDPRVWAAELPESFWSKTPGLIHSFSILTETPEAGAEWSALSEKFTGLGFLQYMPMDALNFAANLNIVEEGEGKGKDKAKQPNASTLEKPLSHLQLKINGDKVDVQSARKGEWKSVAKWTMKKADRADAAAFYKWVTSKIAYDAIVLDVKEELILVALLQNKTELGQGLVIKNSAAKPLVKANKIQGDALLQMLRVEGEYAIFETLLSKTKGKIEVGTKILLGQSDQLKGLMEKKPEN